MVDKLVEFDFDYFRVVPLKTISISILTSNSLFGRVVKAWDLKSHGVTRAGSNPAVDGVFLQIIYKL